MENIKENICNRIEEVEKELNKYPDGFLVYKTINDKKQPYLQWHENGKTKSRYIKVDERSDFLTYFAKKDLLREQYHRLCAVREELLAVWKKYPGLGPQTAMIFQIGLGNQSFELMRERKMFYVDKTMFLKEWWTNPSPVDLILRPRRFGKSLNLDMVDCFFSKKYEARKELFEGLQISEDKKFMELQGSRPVINLSFAAIKTGDICKIEDTLSYYFYSLFVNYAFVLEGDILPDDTRKLFHDTIEFLRSGKSGRLEQCICILSQILYEYYGQKVILLIDEYDTPMLEAWMDGDCKEVTSLFKRFYHATLKRNPYLEKALLTGITRISKESLFYDMNHVSVYSMTDQAYASYFGFTEEEVFAAMDSQQLTEKELVKEWYDGFRIGNQTEIYNPWSISSYLQNGRIATYWVNTSSNEMVESIIRKSSLDFKMLTESLLLGKAIKVHVNESMVFKDLDLEDMRNADESMIWGLLYSEGYLKALDFDLVTGEYTLCVTNKEIEILLERIFGRWFERSVSADYKDFIKAMLSGDEETMDEALEDIAWDTFSIFDVGGKTSAKTAENFYHGFFLGLLTSLRKEYWITSNRESGRGRYDCMMEPLEKSKKAIIIEFKVKRKSELDLITATENAISQIEKMRYKEELIRKGFPDNQILCYGIAFDGKETKVKLKN